MDFERIRLLLEVFHNSLDVPHTASIRKAILVELSEIDNLPSDSPDPPSHSDSEETASQTQDRRL